MEAIVHNNNLLFECPNCSIWIVVDIGQINCSIFRCGIIKDSFDQIGAHAIKDECDNYVSKNLIFGCSKPFKINIRDGKYLISP